MTVQLAFVEEMELPYLFTAVNDIPNKIGGTPIWLNVIPMDSCKCVCGSEMPLLLQIYAPEDYPENAFHRVVYVFCCKNGSCKSFKAFRSQLDLKNDIYTIDGESKIGRVKDHCIQFGEKNIGYCSVCGFKANQVCGHCHVKRYCSREHQQLDWSHGHHKQYCGKGDVPELVQKWMGFFRFPEFGLVQESESEKTIESITKEIEESLNVVEEGDDDLALEDETETEVDKQFLKFQKRIERDPEQVLRYSRTSPDENEEPLWVSDIGKDPEIPNCPCGSKRTFEFQITPQLLSYLELDNTKQDALDWGTLLVYTCDSHCDLANGSYAQEIVICQHFSSQGLGDSIRKQLQERETERETITEE